MPTLFAVVPHPFFFNGEYTVIPPHSMGAASAESSASGILKTKWPGVRL